jgi:putative endonuclease
MMYHSKRYTNIILSCAKRHVERFSDPGSNPGISTLLQNTPIMGVFCKSQKRVERTHCFFKMYFVYILQSTRDGTYYIGYTEDIFERLKTHNSGKVRYTKGHIPYTLAYREQCNNLHDAKVREKAIKCLKNTAYFLKKQADSPDNP